MGENWHRVAAIAERYVELALAAADFSDVQEIAIDETSKARGHDYVTIAADAERRAVIFETETREAQAIERLAADLALHGGDPENISAVSIDMSPKASRGICGMRRSPSTDFTLLLTLRMLSTLRGALSKKRDPRLEGQRLTLLKDRSRLGDERRADLDAFLVANLTTKRTARAWQYREDSHELLNRKQINVVRDMS